MAELFLPRTTVGTVLGAAVSPHPLSHGSLFPAGHRPAAPQSLVVLGLTEGVQRRQSCDNRMALLSLAKVSPLYSQEMAAGSSLPPGRAAPMGAPTWPPSPLTLMKASLAPVETVDAA